MSFVCFQNHTILVNNIRGFSINKEQIVFPATSISGVIEITFNQWNPLIKEFARQRIRYADFQDAQKDYEAALVQLQKSSIQKN